METTDDHVGKALLLLHRIVDVRGDETVQLVEAIVFPFLALRFRVRISARGRIRDELLEELDRGVDQRRRLRAFALRTNDGPGEVLLEFQEEAVKRRAVNEDLQHRVRKAHVTRVY